MLIPSAYLSMLAGRIRYRFGCDSAYSASDTASPLSATERRIEFSGFRYSGL